MHNNWVYLVKNMHISRLKTCVGLYTFVIRSLPFHNKSVYMYTFINSFTLPRSHEPYTAFITLINLLTEPFIHKSTEPIIKTITLKGMNI